MSAEVSRAVAETLPRGPRYGDVIEVTITRLGHAGHGEVVWDVVVGPQEMPRSYVVQVRKAMVGDRVRAVIEGRKRLTLSARLDAVLEPAPGRTEPRCSHYGQRETAGQGCGGCTIQALTYPAQLTAKHARIERAFAAHGMAEATIAPILPMAADGDGEWRYRNKMEFSFGDDRDRVLAVGLYPTGWRNEIVPLTECHLISAAGAGLVPLVRDWVEAQGIPAYSPRGNTGFLRQLTVREGKHTAERLVELVTTPVTEVMTAAGEVSAESIAVQFAAFIQDAAKSLGSQVTSVYWTQHVAIRGHATTMSSQVMAGAEMLHETLTLPGGRVLRFGIHPRAFFQPNPKQAQVLCAEAIARLGEARTVLDLYCGTGTLGMCVAPFVDRVIGVEIVAEAVANAQQNAALNALDNVEYIVGDVGAVLADPALDLGGVVDAVIVDPPRAGLSPKAIAQVVELAPPRLVYVSCNPVTLARDLRVFCDAGYVIEGVVQPVDLFPQTQHVENVVALTWPT
ncbi:MAG: 23S rRNA (uracil1939-C5)-methyltransferase [Myxococcota bacterium]|jgi:23S rRNA (uracil1939-C5)-methyltransferase